MSAAKTGLCGWFSNEPDAMPLADMAAPFGTAASLRFARGGVLPQADHGMAVAFSRRVPDQFEQGRTGAGRVGPVHYMGHQARLVERTGDAAGGRLPMTADRHAGAAVVARCEGEAGAAHGCAAQGSGDPVAAWIPVKHRIFARKVGPRPAFKPLNACDKFLLSLT